MTNTQNIRLAVDAVVFGYETKGVLSVLLIKRGVAPFKGDWALPGGLVDNMESLEEAVYRELKEETGVSIDYLEQLYSFGKPNRDPRNRVVSVSYFALVRPSNFSLHAATDAIEAEWFPIDSLPSLAFDHETILEMALARLRTKLQYQPIGFNLLPKEFPFSAIENLYKTILNRSIDRRNFRKKILSFQILDETDKFHKEGSGRPGKLFTFNIEKYNKIEQEGFHFEIK